MPEEFKNKFIDSLIEHLEEIKKKGKDFEIKVTPDMINEVKLLNGTTYANRNINIDITYNELWTKNEDKITDTWKPYGKGDK